MSPKTKTTPPLPSRPSLLASLPLLGVLVGVAAGCGTGLLRPGEAAPPTLFSVKANARGALAADFSGELRGALAWSIYSDELIECLDGVPVDQPLDFANDEDLAIARRVELCWGFSERGRRENASVSIEAAFPSSFTIPVAALPDPSLLSGEAGALLGIADVVVYADDNANGSLDETPRGADAFVDRVAGTSRALDEFATEASWIVYREGEVSPLWKIFRALYGCADPAPGFSRMHIAIDEFSGAATCAFDQEPIDVVLQDDIESLGCAADPESLIMQRAVTAEGWSADSAGVCEAMDGYYDLYLTENPSSVCPSFRRVTLVGCSDTSSEEACGATLWDDVGSEPGWWPCKYSDGSNLSFFLENPVFATDENDEALFELFWFDGLGDISPSRMAIVLDDEATPGPDITLGAAGFVLVDADDNGIFNAGDRLVVGETANQLTTQTPPGAYRVRVTIDGVDTTPFQTMYYAPVDPPQVTSISIFAADAAAPITDGIDDLAVVTHLGFEGDAFGFPFSDITASVYVGGELPLDMSPETGSIVIANDVDGDGLFENGDSLVLRDASAEPYQQLSPEVIASFTGNLSITLYVKTGVNTRAPFAYTDVLVE